MPFKVRSYGIQSADGCEEFDPNAWTVKGQTTNEEWLDIHKVTNQVFESRWEWQYFPVGDQYKDTLFKAIKIVIHRLRHDCDESLQVGAVKVFQGELAECEAEKEVSQLGETNMNRLYAR